MKKNATYYFGPVYGPKMDAMPRRKLYARLAEAYQLAGSLLIGSQVLERGTAKARNVNGWTDKEVDDAIETLLDFLSVPAMVSVKRLRNAMAVYQAREVADDS